jgi:hypothetical protein
MHAYFLFYFTCFYFFFIFYKFKQASDQAVFTRNSRTLATVTM